MIPSWACARWHIVIVPSNTSEYTLALTTNLEYIIVWPWLTNSLSFSGRERVGPGPVAIMSPVPFSRVLFRSRSISFSRSSVFLVYIIRTRIHYALSHILPGPLYWLRPRVTQPSPPPTQPDWSLFVMATPNSWNKAVNDVPVIYFVAFTSFMSDHYIIWLIWNI